MLYCSIHVKRRFSIVMWHWEVWSIKNHGDRNLKRIDRGWALTEKAAKNKADRKLKELYYG
jgi:hypothetical protein